MSTLPAGALPALAAVQCVGVQGTWDADAGVCEAGEVDDAGDVVLAQGVLSAT